MTKTDFQFIADVLSTVRANVASNPNIPHEFAGVAEGALELVTQEFANRLAVGNPRFDRHRFINAATVPANERK